ncbi:hypothetical protein HYU06_04105 [Candidatus Woesearchaeota archaeon]|nr:hypothetical protein [Candidatus Woesearchaeota archaeon]
MAIKENIPIIDERLYDAAIREHIQLQISERYKSDSPYSLPLSPLDLFMLHQGFVFVENVLVGSEDADLDGSLSKIVDRLTRTYGSMHITTEHTEDGQDKVLQADYVQGECPIGYVSNVRLGQPARPSLDRERRAFGVYVRFAWPGEEPKNFENLIREKVLEGFRINLDEVVSESAGKNMYLPPAYVKSVIEGLMSLESLGHAADLAAKVGWKEYSTGLWHKEAVHLETEKHYASAAEAMLKAGSETEAKRLFTLAMEESASWYHFKDAATYATQAGLPDKAAEYANLAEKWDNPFREDRENRRFS